MYKLYNKFFKRGKNKRLQKLVSDPKALIETLPTVITEILKEKIREDPAFSDILLRVYNALGPKPLGACVSRDGGHTRSYMNECREVYYDIFVDIKNLMKNSGLYDTANKKIETLSDVDEFISKDTEYTLNEIIINGIKGALDADQSEGPLFKDVTTPNKVYEKTDVVPFSYSPSPVSREKLPVKLDKENMSEADIEMMRNIEKLLGRKLPSSPSSSSSSRTTPRSSPSVSANSSFDGGKKSRRKKKTVKRKRRKNKTRRARK